MQMILVGVGILLVILMVAFGRNPIEEAREKRAQMGSRDPLVKAIEDYNEKSSHGFGSAKEFNFSSGGSMALTEHPDAVTIRRNPSYSYPGYMMQTPPNAVPGQNPFAAASPYRLRQGQPPAAQPQNSYYPPAPATGQASPLQQPQPPSSAF